ncbi:hypothetical protein K470DRAFT_269770 [Piedraia hortae CBS 480.64]|uniref:Vacuolar ATPase assembly protein VMA22 n=1 Tax=Piedraia hortae CBS 480.64 TaxID=1314780 RepID=A0A6A7C1Q2_9PEZI|nr:hypothetical protein K470DRAFT_269770 [Piedraia hortae CBS 480.64]
MGSLDRLNDELDRLWMRYLAALSQYTEARDRMQQNLSMATKGLVSLARANYAGKCHHGKEFYDDRMRASTECSITEHGELNVSQVSSEKDPIKWFGILVPRDLRSTQASFRRIVLNDVTEAVNAAAEMRALEREIRRKRKEVRKADRTASDHS